MAEKRPQTFANHTRIDPLFHFFVLPVSGLVVLGVIFHSILHIVREPGVESVVHGVIHILLAFALLTAVIKIRTYSLKVQDRVIRLEERLRLTQILPEPLRSRIPELTEDQLCGLRFASDGEVAKLAERALNEKLSRKDIKAAIKNWRPDYWRV
jgi:hypothetical protein